MGGRYWITGVQLGMLIASPKEDSKKISDNIIDNQYIGDAEDVAKLLRKIDGRSKA